MAKPELIDHRKFLKLKRLLGEIGPHVVGYLEYMWRRGYQTGDPFIGDAADVEAAAEYPGELGTFATAAHQSGFLDVDQDGKYSIHDLYEHAPAYVKKRMDRKGTAPKRPAKDKKTPNPLPNGRQVVPNGSENAEKPPAWRTKTDLDPRSKNQEPTTDNQTFPQPPAEEKPSVGSSEPFDPLKAEAEAKRLFLERWNGAGLKPLKALNPSLQGRLHAALLDSWWAENYPAAIERASKSPFLREGLERNKGRLDPMEFLSEPDLVRRILDGDFDPRQRSRASPPKSTLSEQFTGGMQAFLAGGKQNDS